MRNFASLLAGLTLLAAAPAQTLIHTSQSLPAHSPSHVTQVQAAPAAQFVDSIGVATHLNYLNTPYRDLPKYERLLLASGIHNIRDGGTNQIAVSRFKEMNSHGLSLTWIMDAADGVAPTSRYWTSPPHYTLMPFLKQVLAIKHLRAIEVSNEIDIFYPNKRWLSGDTQSLSNNPQSNRYWGNYIQSLVLDTWKVVRADPAFSRIQVLGTSFGGESAGVPRGAFLSDTDAGTFHPYLYRGNSSITAAQPYDEVPQYFADSTQPSIDIDEYPTEFQLFDSPYQGPVRVKPMIATETGYYTGTDPYSISETAQARYVPRIYAENFRHNIAETFIYEFLDEGSDGTTEHSFGLVRADLTPKPAYYALQSLIRLLNDPGTPRRPAGKLAYQLTVSSTNPNARLQYAHDLLLQKTNGDFYLLLWHEISDANRTSPTGVPVRGTDRDISPEDLTARIALPNHIKKVTAFHYNDQWELIPTPLLIAGSAITTPVSDKITVLRLASR